MSAPLLASRHRPLLQHLRPLPDSQPNPRSMLDRRREDFSRLVEIAPGIEHVVHLGTVLGPFLNLVEVAVVRNRRIAGLFGGLAYRGWIVLCRQAMQVDFLDPTFSASLVLAFKRLKWRKFDERLFGFSKVSPKFIHRAS
jgi:hypothetical protein